MMGNFTPHYGSGASVSATTTTARSQLQASTPGGSGNDVAVWNDGSSTVFVRLGDSTVNATVADFPLVPNAGVILNAASATHIAAITASGTSTVRAIPGKGF